MSLYSDIFNKILDEVDPDIKETMLATDGKYKAFEMLADPANTVLAWQAMRDRKNDNYPNTKKPRAGRE